ncbi:transcriptional regulator with XRE-family HTH domain [Kitasatospora sp. MAA19]|uniref:helix-turn-helix domain-containing protein n=1 Tax=unclassified Kitasatospora TaxID=2633591 RepID=UPI002474A7DD|nr:helix-turn-helix transcriptional regulator [Kitasatospora sp. MAA19]MDH6705424.1 transcriptional regulator with XRE-family HTH domain [Kitasatospora sp. MAA19]
MRETELNPSASPLKAFGAQLRRLRKAAGLTQIELGELTNLSDSQISNLERGTRIPTLDWVKAADQVLGAGGTLELTYWSLSGGGSLLEGFPEYAVQESKAIELRQFELGVIPGLFQTKAYAEALAAADVRRGAITAEEAETRVSYLLTRQQRLDSNDAPVMHAVLDESCIRRLVGGAAVMREQLEHLAELAERPRTIIQVAPFSMGERRSLALPVVLLTLSDRSLLGYTESQERGFLTRETGTVTLWSHDYDRLQVGASSDVASLDMIRAARKDLRS